MPANLFQKGLHILLKRQTNILSAAFVIMFTVILSQIFGLIRQRLLVSFFSASNTLGVYLAAGKLPDLLFQLVIAGALSTAFIPVFTEHLDRGEREAHKMASTLLTLGVSVFAVVSAFLFLFAPFFLQIMNVGAGFTPEQMTLMATLMRVIIVSQLLFIIATFFTALLQSYNHFFVPGIAAALYNLGIIIGIVFLSPQFGIFGPAFGTIIGASFFILFQLPMVRKVGFSFIPSISYKVPGVMEVFKLMWPRTLSIAVFQTGGVAVISLISFLHSAGRSYVIFDYAQTLAFAPVGLFGQAIAQAAFPVLARERERLSEFRATFATSFSQMLYLVLPISVLFLVLRIPVVRLIYGAAQFDWQATVLTGRTLAFFSLSIFAQALTYLVSRGFYALHDTKTPLIVGAITTVLMIILGYISVVMLRFGVASIAMAFSLANIVNLFLLLYLLDKKAGGFRSKLYLPVLKIFAATFFTGFALYVPIKLLDQLVVDTTKTVGLLMLTGISSLSGLLLYLFLTWLFNVREATTFILLFKRIGNWREILTSSEEVIETPQRIT